MKAQVATTVNPESGMLLKPTRGAAAAASLGATLGATRMNNLETLRTRGHAAPPEPSLPVTIASRAAARKAQRRDAGLMPAYAWVGACWACMSARRR